MREILFRGKHINPYVDKWVEGYYALLDGEHVIIMPHSTSYQEALKENRPIPKVSVNHTIDINTLGQYTGLKDENGKKIFEGDIVKDNYCIYEVVYDGNGFYIEVKILLKECGTDKGILYDLSDYKDLEVIGNIYDNPELIEEGE